MLTEPQVESNTERLARLLYSWRYDRSRLVASDVGWLLEHALEAQESGVTVCKECARNVADPAKGLCWYCVRDAEFLEGGIALRPVAEDTP